MTTRMPLRYTFTFRHTRRRNRTSEILISIQGFIPIQRTPVFFARVLSHDRMTTRMPLRLQFYLSVTLAGGIEPVKF